MPESAADYNKGNGRFAIWASNGGAPTHPRWYHNLKAHPRITAEVGDRTLTVLAEELDDDTRARLWPKLVAEYHGLGETQAKSARPFPVLLLTAQD